MVCSSSFYVSRGSLLLAERVRRTVHHEDTNVWTHRLRRAAVLLQEAIYQTAAFGPLTHLQLAAPRR